MVWPHLRPPSAALPGKAVRAGSHFRVAAVLPARLRVVPAAHVLALRARWGAAPASWKRSYKVRVRGGPPLASYSSGAH